jgi:hypothetical protein
MMRNPGSQSNPATQQSFHPLREKKHFSPFFSHCRSGAKPEFHAGDKNYSFRGIDFGIQESYLHFLNNEFTTPTTSVPF